MPGSLPNYTENKKKGNIGEALVQYILSSIALVHKIDGSNDVGNDFICELIKDEYPTNLLFYVQVKFAKKPKIKKETLEYWKGSPIPVYIFWIKEEDPPQERNISQLSRSIKYKACTPLLHQNLNLNKNRDFKIFERSSFLKDLLSDYSKTQYIKGFTSVLQPRDFLTLEEKTQLEFPRYQLNIADIYTYKEQIISSSGANLLSLAISLKDKGEKEKAYKAMELARSLISNEDLDKYHALIREWDKFKVE